MNNDSQDIPLNKNIQDGASAGGDNAGVDGEVPGTGDGVGVGATDEPNTFEPEEAGEGVDDD